MKKIMMTLIASASVFAFTGCSTTNTNDAASPVKITTSANYEAIYDLKEEKVSGEATVHTVLSLFTWGVDKYADDAFATYYPLLDGVTTAKQGASYNACEAAKADALIGAKYEVITDNYFVYKKVKAKVVGYPATLKGVKLIK